MIDAFDVMEENIVSACKSAGHKKIFVIYSAYKTDRDDEPINNLHKIAVRGKVVFYCERDEFYGGKKSKNYISEVLISPTWLQVAVCANAMIHCTRDNHHVFLEGVGKRKQVGDKELKDKLAMIENDDVKVYELHMGS